MTSPRALPQLAAIATNDRATPSLIYRALLRGIRDGSMVPGAKLPNERELAEQLNTSRGAVRTALAMMERQGLVHRRVGSGTFLAEDAHEVFERMDQTQAADHAAVPSFAEIVEGRLLFEPAMMHLVVNRVDDGEVAEMRRILDDRRAVSFDGRDTDKPAPDAVRRQTYNDLSAIVDAIAERNGKRAEELVSDHLMRTLATVNIWQ
jgi:DNA-binding FadR family transcriptional regulator